MDSAQGVIPSHEAKKLIVAEVMEEDTLDSSVFSFSIRSAIDNKMIDMLSIDDPYLSLFIHELVKRRVERLGLDHEVQDWVTELTEECMTMLEKKYGDLPASHGPACSKVSDDHLPLDPVLVDVQIAFEAENSAPTGDVVDAFAPEVANAEMSSPNEVTTNTAAPSEENVPFATVKNTNLTESDWKWMIDTWIPYWATEYKRRQNKDKPRHSLRDLIVQALDDPRLRGKPQYTATWSQWRGQLSERDLGGWSARSVANTTRALNDGCYDKPPHKRDRRKGKGRGKIKAKDSQKKSQNPS
ncbi:uncharacterized protein DNG_02175 [Cephalotrichum gorgonifer]|uniref:Uncharacterized protein n=1 Tax=Cephalotrichum gorgonifer TaxID=2041049 RepID=A0AAE8MU17_9PEZI|nr:uncharacterized protein DNG_02175 [Cephalotrichum gorgonifer]